MTELIQATNVCCIMDHPATSFSRRLAYASPELSLTIAFALINSWYLFFLVEVAGLPPFLAGLAFTVGRIFDAAMDPLVGRWSDRLSERQGRKFLPAAALIPAAFCFFVMWLVPVVATSSALVFAAATTAFCCFSFFYTMLSVPRLAMLPWVEPTAKGRTTQVVLNTVLIFVAAMAATAILPVMVAPDGGENALSKSELSDWYTVLAAASAIMIVAYIPFLLFVPEADASEGQLEGQSVHLSIKSLLVHSPMQRALTLFVLGAVALFSAQATLPFVFERQLRLAPGDQSLVMVIVFGSAFVSFPIWFWLSRKFSKVDCLLLGMVPFALFLASVPLLPTAGEVGPIVVTACVLAGLGIAPLNIFPWAMMPDAVEAWCRQMGQGCEGLAVSAFTFAFKLAGAIGVLGVALVLQLLDTFHTDPGKSSNVAPLVAVPAVAVGLLILFSWSLPAPHKATDTS